MWRDVRDRLVRPLTKGPVTSGYPSTPPDLPAAARGMPRIRVADHDALLPAVAACPTGAITLSETDIRLDLGRCILCGACADATGGSAITMSSDIELASRRREDLIVVVLLGSQASSAS